MLCLSKNITNFASKIRNNSVFSIQSCCLSRLYCGQKKYLMKFLKVITIIVLVDVLELFLLCLITFLNYPNFYTKLWRCFSFDIINKKLLVLGVLGVLLYKYEIILSFGISDWRCSCPPSRRLTGHYVCGNYFHNYFSTFPVFFLHRLLFS